MLPQLSAIPLQTSANSNDSAQNINRLLPVGQNVSATVVAVSRDQVQPEIFRLKLEVNNRLIQMGVFQALPVGQKININRQSDGQIQISAQPTQTPTNSTPTNSQAGKQLPADTNFTPRSNNEPSLQLKLAQPEVSAKLPANTRISAAVISSRPVYPATPNTTAPTTISNQMVNSATVNQITSNPPSTGASQPRATATANSGSTPQGNLNTSPSINSAANTQTGLQASTSNNSLSSPTNQPANISQASNSAPANSQANPSPVGSSNPVPNQALNQAAIAAKTSPDPLANTEPRSQTAAPSAVAERPGNAQASQPLPPTNPTRSAAPIHHLVSLALPDGSKVEVQSPRPLPQGAQLQLATTATQTLQVVRIQEPPLSPNSALDKPAIQEALRNALPIQQPTATAFSQLAQVASAVDSNQSTQIGSVVRSMLQLFGVRPGSADAPAQIRQNVELGGLGTERQLSQGGTTSPLDMKAQLQQLQQLSDKLPTEQRERLEQIVQSLSSRVTSQQLNSLQQWRELPDGGFERVLQLDLPIKQGEHWDNLELRLSREGGTNAAGDMVSVWRVRLHFDLQEQGGVDAEIRLTDGHEISTLFWCEHPETAEKLRERSEEFAEKLRMCGFNNSEVTWHEGNAPTQNQVVHKQLIDLHT